MSATSNWLDFSANSNLSNPTYMTGFLDISYGNVFLRNSNLFIKSADASLGGRLFVAADASLNGNLTLGGNLVVNGNLSVKQFTQSNIINTITTNVFSVNEDLNLAGRLYVSGDVSFNGGNLRVGVAPTNVSGVAVLDIVDQNNQIFNLTEYNNFDGAVIRGRRALGTAAAPLAVTADTTLTGLRGFGYNGTNLGSTRNVDIGLMAAETYTSTAQGSYIYFGTSATGTTTCSERMRISPSGNVGIGTTTPGFPLDIIGSERLTGNLLLYNQSNPTLEVRSSEAPYSAKGAATLLFNGTQASNYYPYGAVQGTDEGYENNVGTFLGALRFYSVYNLRLNEGMRLNSSGYLGVNNIKPTTALDMQGTLRISTPLTATITPSTSGVGSASWWNGGVNWTASASSDPTRPAWNAFTGATADTTAVLGWQSVTTAYTSDTGTYTGTTTTGNIITSSISTNNTTYMTTCVPSTSITGEWLQIKSSTPVVMNSYTFTCCADTTSSKCFIQRMPGSYNILGSNDGIQWYVIQQSYFTALPFTGGSATSTSPQTTPSYSVSGIGSNYSLQNTNNATMGTGYASKPFTYFRIVVQSALGATYGVPNNGGATSPTQFGWNITFNAMSAATITASSAYSGQLNVNNGAGLTITHPTNTTNPISLYPYLGAGSYNNIVANNDAAIIFGDGGGGSKGFAIAPWGSNVTSGLRVNNAGNVNINGTTTVTYSGGYAINAYSTGTGNADGALSVINTNRDVMGLFAPGYGNYLHVGAWNANGSGAKNIVMQALGGYVGIGTTDPTKMLTVAGDALINGLTVGLGGGAIGTNAAFGPSALNANTTGSVNVAVGQTALFKNTTGVQNSAVGQAALYSNTTGVQNSAFGQGALQFNTTGIQNTAVGVLALYSNTTGGNNSAFGQNALNSTTTGSTNTALGFNAGNTGTANTIGSNNTYLGYNTGSSANNLSNSTAIGTGATITASNQIVLGTSSETTTIPGKLSVAGSMMSYISVIDSVGSTSYPSSQAQANTVFGTVSAYGGAFTSSSLSNNTVTIPVAGNYYIMVSVSVAGPTSGCQCILSLTKNAASTLAATVGSAYTGQWMSLNISGIFTLAANDVIAVPGSTGGAYTVHVGGQGYKAVLTIIKM